MDESRIGEEHDLAESRRIREEQDLAFQESLRIDREKDQEKSKIVVKIDVSCSSLFPSPTFFFFLSFSLLSSEKDLRRSGMVMP